MFFDVFHARFFGELWSSADVIRKWSRANPAYVCSVVFEHDAVIPVEWYQPPETNAVSFFVVAIILCSCSFGDGRFFVQFNCCSFSPRWNHIHGLQFSRCVRSVQRQQARKLLDLDTGRWSAVFQRTGLMYMSMCNVFVYV